MALYDSIGQHYGALRREDPRIARHILHALGDAASVVNVGAGTGSYEPRDRKLVAVEPSRVMLRQRRRDAAPAVRASGMQLPFRDTSFDASLAILTLHHWPDLARGLHELRRAARHRVVILTYDPWASFWLMDYFPEISEIDAARSAISAFSKLRRLEPGLAALRSDLASGAWQRRYGQLLARSEIDLGYRLVVA